MRIVFMGEDGFSAIVLESLINSSHVVLGVFCPFHNKHSHDRIKFICEINNIRLYEIKNINSSLNNSRIKKLQPDLIVVAHFRKLLGSNIFGIPKYGCINVHPSLLPEYRGLSPIQQPIIHGDSVTGVTVHFIDKGIDTGSIILQKKIALKKDMYVSELQREISKVYRNIIPEAIQLIVSSPKKFINQEHLKGSYFEILKEEDCEIDIMGGFIKGYNLIRGVSIPYFGAKYDNYRIWRASPLSNKENDLLKKKYKTIGFLNDPELGKLLKFNDGFLSIEKFSPIN